MTRYEYGWIYLRLALEGLRDDLVDPINDRDAAVDHGDYTSDVLVPSDSDTDHDRDRWPTQRSRRGEDPRYDSDGAPDDVHDLVPGHCAVIDGKRKGKR